MPSGNPLLAAARAVGLWRSPPVGAIHELTVQAPDGTSRTFRAGTESANVPGQVGERVTVVSAPGRGVSKQQRLIPLSTAPPGVRACEPLAVCNHGTGEQLPLLRPPVSGSAAGMPGWLLPAVVVLAGSDAASALIDPSLPALIAAGAVAVVGSGVAGRQLVVPKLKQLPERSVRVEAVRQQLLAQHAGLASKVKATLQVGYRVV